MHLPRRRPRRRSAPCRRPRRTCHCSNRRWSRMALRRQGPGRDRSGRRCSRSSTARRLLSCSLSVARQGRSGRRHLPPSQCPPQHSCAAVQSSPTRRHASVTHRSPRQLNEQQSAPVVHAPPPHGRGWCMHGSWSLRSARSDPEQHSPRVAHAAAGALQRTGGQQRLPSHRPGAALLPVAHEASSGGRRAPAGLTHWLVPASGTKVLGGAEPASAPAPRGSTVSTRPPDRRRR